MADANGDNRPLSPFMIGQYYRPQMTSISSIMVRITGNALILAAMLIVWWLLAAATSSSYFEVVDGIITCWVGDLIMFFSAWALWYHLLGGVRHLLWDFGYCLEVAISEKLGWGMFIGATILTIFTAIVV
ncbi:MAG: succinate dehydrogenase, cytochrome b556 subunit [Celeribacter marinus]